MLIADRPGEKTTAIAVCNGKGERIMRKRRGKDTKRAYQKQKAGKRYKTERSFGTIETKRRSSAAAGRKNGSLKGGLMEYKEKDEKGKRKGEAAPIYNLKTNVGKAPGEQYMRILVNKNGGPPGLV